jgi:hypothetical protein
MFLESARINPTSGAVEGKVTPWENFTYWQRRNEDYLVAAFFICAVILFTYLMIWLESKHRKFFEHTVVILAATASSFFLCWAYIVRSYGDDLKKPLLFALGVFCAMGAWFAYKHYFLKP